MCVPSHIGIGTGEGEGEGEGGIRQGPDHFFSTGYTSIHTHKSYMAHASFVCQPHVTRGPGLVLLAGSTKIL